MGTESEHAHIIRAAHHRRHDTARSALTVAAVLFFVAFVTVMAPKLAHSAASGGTEVSGLPQGAATALPHPIAHDIAIETVPRGNEGLELSARLTDDGGIIQRNQNLGMRSAIGELDRPCGTFQVGGFCGPFQLLGPLLQLFRLLQ